MVHLLWGSRFEPRFDAEQKVFNKGIRRFLSCLMVAGIGFGVFYLVEDGTWRFLGIATCILSLYVAEIIVWVYGDKWGKRGGDSRG